MVIVIAFTLVGNVYPRCKSCSHVARQRRSFQKGEEKIEMEGEAGIITPSRLVRQISGVAHVLSVTHKNINKTSDCLEYQRDCMSDCNRAMNVKEFQRIRIVTLHRANVAILSSDG